MTHENPFAPGTPLHAVAGPLFGRGGAAAAGDEPAAPLPLVAKKAWDDETAARLSALADADASANVRAGLHLLNDDLEAAHALVQPRERDITASYWHYFVHLREGDWENAKYWLRRSLDHPLHEAARQDLIASGIADMSREKYARARALEVDFVRDRHTGRGGAAAAARPNIDPAPIQFAEMRRLLAWCVQNKA